MAKQMMNAIKQYIFFIAEVFVVCGKNQSLWLMCLSTKNQLGILALNSTIWSAITPKAKAPVRICFP